jgi:shikimate kinase
MNIVLVGFMCSGKSMAAEMIAEQTGMEVVEIDDMIIKRSGYRSINEIFDNEGEARHRELEMEIAKELSEADNKIIDTGGGIIMNQLNMLYLKKNGKVFYVECDWGELERRSYIDDIRPLFRDKEKAKELLELREPLYKAYADHIVNGNSTKKAVEDILKVVEENEY